MTLAFVCTSASSSPSWSQAVYLETIYPLFGVRHLLGMRMIQSVAGKGELGGNVESDSEFSILFEMFDGHLVVFTPFEALRVSESVIFLL